MEKEESEPPSASDKPTEAKKKPKSKTAAANGGGSGGGDEDTGKDKEVAEARRQKSREAAKTRRDQENHEIFKISQLLPLPPDIADNLDKSSVLRLALGCIRLKSFLGEGGSMYPSTVSADDTSAKAGTSDECPNDETASECEEDKLSSLPRNPDTVFTPSARLLSSLRGFLMVVASDGCVIFCSSNVRQLLGIREVEIIGQHMKDFVLKDDLHVICAQLKRLRVNASEQAAGLGEQFTPIRAAIADEEIEELINDVEPAKECCFTLHMKCFSERKANGKAASSHASMVASTKGMTYELVRFQGAYQDPQIDRMIAMDTTLGLHSMVILCRPIESVHTATQLMGTLAFQTRHSLDLSFLDCCERTKEFTGYGSESLNGQSMYGYIHPEDAKKLREKHKQLLNGNQSISVYIRYMLPSSENLLVLMVASIYKSPKNGRPMCINAINYIVSQDRVEGQWHSLVDENATAAAAQKGAHSSPSGLPGEWLGTNQIQELIANPHMAGDAVVKQYFSEQAASASEAEANQSDAAEAPSAKRSRLPSLADTSLPSAPPGQQGPPRGRGRQAKSLDLLPSTPVSNSAEFPGSGFLATAQSPASSPFTSFAPAASHYDPGFMQAPGQPHQQQQQQMQPSAASIAYQTATRFMQGAGDIHALQAAYGGDGAVGFSALPAGGTRSTPMFEQLLSPGQHGSLQGLVAHQQQQPSDFSMPRSARTQHTVSMANLASATVEDQDFNSGYWSQMLGQVGQNPPPSLDP